MKTLIEQLILEKGKTTLQLKTVVEKSQELTKGTEENEVMRQKHFQLNGKLNCINTLIEIEETLNNKI